MSVNQDPSTWRLRTAGGIPYKKKSLSGEYDREKAGAQETYIIRASDLQAFAEESFPIIESLGGVVIFDWERTMPGAPLLYTRKLSYKGLDDSKPNDPFGSDATAPDGTYEEFLEVTISYEPSILTSKDKTDDPLTFLEVTSEASTNFLADTQGALGARWEPLTGTTESTGVNVSFPVSVIEPCIDWSFKWPLVPYQFFSDKLISRIRARLGMVNSGPTTLFHNAPAETILFLGYSIGQSLTWRKKDGVTMPPLNITFKFREKNFTSVEDVQVTHNHFYREGKGWRRLLVNGEPTFAMTDLNQLFAVL